MVPVVFAKIELRPAPALGATDYAFINFRPCDLSEDFGFTWDGNVVIFEFPSGFSLYSSFLFS